MAAPEEAVASGAVTAPAALLEVSNLRAGYGRRPVTFSLDLDVRQGEVVALFGHNGAGKTTTLKAIFGTVHPMGGTVRFDGADITGVSSAGNVSRGLTLIPAENFVFAELNVLDNLRLGAHLEPSSDVIRQRLARVYELFPILEERGAQIAGTMSGGQQRMLSIGVALMSGPRLLLLDEPSLGLSPALVGQMMTVISRLAREEGLSALLVEQNVAQTLPVVDRAYFMRSGRMILEESSEELRKRSNFWDLF